MSRIGVIGGSGLYNLEGADKKDEIYLNTPFGRPSDKFILMEFAGKEVVFLPRHGREHTVNPSQINYRANIYGMKQLGVERLISVSACGSLKEELKPTDFVIPLQFVDRTNQGRPHTFFDEGIVVHVSLAYPICEELAKNVLTSARNVGVSVHDGGTYLNMEGPQFSTLAESNLYRMWGMDIIGMTNMTEARLAREAEICYVSLCAVTDYDCWRQEEEAVTVDIILEYLRKNTENAKKILRTVIPFLDGERTCSCREALKYAIVTNTAASSVEIKKKLNILIGKYM